MIISKRLGLTEPHCRSIPSVARIAGRSTVQCLLAFLKDRQAAMCANCQRRIDRNPLRALDCKEAWLH